MVEPSTAAGRSAAQSNDMQRSGWLSRARLVALFWVGAAIGLAAMAYVGHVGWDSKDYWKTIQDLRQGIDPYAAGIAATRVFRSQYVPGTPENLPIVYHYPPLTLPLLRMLEGIPGWVLGLLYGAAVALGALLQLWAGLQMADKDERRWLALLLPALLFFPGLITDDVILSGNVAYILYGAVLAAAVPGWKRGNWRWYYVAILAASVWKLPFLSLLAFPVLVEWRQWFRAGITAGAGVLIFAAQMKLWPELFREYVVAIRMMFEWKREFGFSPSGVLGKALLSRGLPTSPATTVLHLAFAGVLGIGLLVLGSRVRRRKLPMERWVPVALVGTVLLSPRIMKYDLAAISVPMLLMGWRALRAASGHRADQDGSGHADGGRQMLSNRAAILVGTGCFLIPNVLTVVRPSWYLVECVVLLAIFALGVWSLDPSPRDA
jgi:hypothetical protein